MNWEKIVLLNQENYKKTVNIIEELYKSNQLLWNIKTVLIKEWLHINSINRVFKKLHNCKIHTCYSKEISQKNVFQDHRYWTLFLWKDSSSTWEQNTIDTKLSIFNVGGEKNNWVQEVSFNKLQQKLKKIPIAKVNEKRSYITENYRTIPLHGSIEKRERKTPTPTSPSTP